MRLPSITTPDYVRWTVENVRRAGRDPATVTLVAATERATAIALGVFAIHLLGDALSPFLIGELSDAFSLEAAVKIVPIAVAIGGCVWAWAARAQAQSNAQAT